MIDRYKAQKIVEKLGDLPHKKIVVSVLAGFFSSAILSFVLSVALTPKIEKNSFKNKRQSSQGPIISSKASLDGAKVKEIIDRNLFNREGKVPDEAEGADNDEVVITSSLIKSSLKVEITGVIFGGSPFHGIVMVKNSARNKINSFMVGDFLLPGEGEILEIWPDRIIINRNGQNEYIDVPKQEVVRSSRTKKKSSSTPQKSKSPGFASGVVQENYSEEGFDRKKDDITMTQSYKQKLLGPDFAKILQDAKATPHIVDGEIRGYALSRIRENSVWQKAGFVDGDVVEEINGVPLGDTGKVIPYLNSLRTANSIEIRYNRSGSSQTKNLEVQ